MRIAIVGVVLLTACTANDPPRAVSTDTLVPSNAVVVDVVDGDTIDVAIGDVIERVRLIGVDTPETKKPNTPVECFGPEASAFTRSMLPPGTPVRLERDVEARDAYDRLLAYVVRATDGQQLNVELVAQGYARPFPFEPNTSRAGEFADAARRAADAGLGLWRACNG